MAQYIVVEDQMVRPTLLDLSHLTPRQQLAYRLGICEADRGLESCDTTYVDPELEKAYREGYAWAVEQRKVIDAAITI